MWSVPPLPSPRTWLPNIIVAGTKPPKRCLPLKISAMVIKHNNANGNDQDQDSTKRFSNTGKAVLTAVKSNPSKPKEKQNHQGELSGADVLRALQKAATNKAKKTKRDTVLTTRNRKNEAANEDGDAVDYSNVRPLCIKSDWSSRMNELEEKLQELIDA